MGRTDIHPDGQTKSYFELGAPPKKGTKFQKTKFLQNEVNQKTKKILKHHPDPKNSLRGPKKPKNDPNKQKIENSESQKILQTEIYQSL